MSIDPTTDSIVDNFFLKKKRKKPVYIGDTHYYIAYTWAYNVLGNFDKRGTGYAIMTWRFSPDCNLSISTDLLAYDVNDPELTVRLMIMNGIIRGAHERFNTQLITVCEPHHFYMPHDNTRRYDILDALSIDLTVVPTKQAFVTVTPTYEQMAVLL